MSKIGQANLALTSDDMGTPPDVELKLEDAQREWELSKYTTDELQNELLKRGYVNGVLLYPELDEKELREV